MYDATSLLLLKQCANLQIISRKLKMFVNLFVTFTKAKIEFKLIDLSVRDREIWL